MNKTIQNRFVRQGLVGAVVTFAAWLLPVAPSGAQVTVAASGSSRYEYDSNVLDLQGGLPIPGTRDFQHSDRLYTYGAAVDVNYLWERQKFFARLADNEFRYDHFTPLDHNEYSVDTGLDWKLFTNLDGTLDVQRNRSMVAFTNTNTAQFDLQTEQRENAKLGYGFMPEWRLEGAGYHRAVTQVFLNAPTLDLGETSGSMALQYVGRAGLTAGINAAHVDGKYSGASAALNPSYGQNSFGLNALFVPTGRTSISTILGYTQRKSASDLNSISGFTGEFDFDNQLTGKTTVHLLISRSINSYVANVSSEIDSAATLSARWQATYKLGIAVAYNWTKRDLPGQGNEGVLSNRLDHLNYVSLAANYEPARWISIKPYVNYQTRSSNLIGGNFNATVYGVYFTVRWQNSRETDPQFLRLNEPSNMH